VAALVAVVGLTFIYRVTRQLRQMAREVDEGAREVASTATQVSMSAQSLAQSASEQAAWLEQGTATMAELSSMTKQNADSARKKGGPPRAGLPGGDRIRRRYRGHGDRDDGHASLRALVVDSPLVNFHRPSVDLLFQSAAQLRDVTVVGLLLTGMGYDGAQGMVALRQAGAETIAQDEHSSVVFGMPKAAIERGGAAQVATLTDMAPAIIESLGRLRARRLAVRRPAAALK
jgi:hypothetical protein